MISLVHPDGTTLVLRNKEGGSGNNIDLWYGFDGFPMNGAASLKGKPTKGEWKVIVKDLAARDEGTLDLVELRIKGYF